MGPPGRRAVTRRRSLWVKIATRLQLIAILGAAWIATCSVTGEPGAGLHLNRRIVRRPVRARLIRINGGRVPVRCAPWPAIFPGGCSPLLMTADRWGVG